MATGLGLYPQVVTPGIHDGEDRHRERSLALIATSFLVACVIGWLAFEIPKGMLSNPDELLTAERTREMLLTRQPWVVHFNFSPSFAKPPLQYWLSALTLPHFENKALAIRIWPLIYGALTAIALGWLALLVDPARPWLWPMAVALLASCPRFSVSAAGAWLDMGLTFFTTMVVIFAELARRQPRWWLAAAIACILGSLQKVPIPFCFLAFIVLLRFYSPNERQGLRNKWLVISLTLAILGIVGWWAVQVLKYQMPFGKVFSSEVLAPLRRSHLGGGRPLWEILYKLADLGWVGGGWLAWVALFAVFFWKRQRFSPATREVASVCLMFLALFIASGFRSNRYVAPIMPCLCLLIAIVVYRLLQQGGLARKGAVALLALVFFSGLVEAKLEMHIPKKNAADSKSVAEKLGSMQREDTRMVLVRPSSHEPSGRMSRESFHLYRAFYLFHGNLRFPIMRSRIDEFRQMPPQAPVLGVCVTRDFPIVQEVYPNVERQFTQGQLVLWRVASP